MFLYYFAFDMLSLFRSVFMSSDSLLTAFIASNPVCAGTETGVV